MSVKIYENGVWRDASFVRRYNGSSWVDVGAVKKYENGQWTTVFPSFAVGTTRMDFIDSGISYEVPLEGTPITCGYFENPVPPGTYTVEVDSWGWWYINRNDSDYNAYIYFNMYGVDVSTGSRLFTVYSIASSSDSGQSSGYGNSSHYIRSVCKSFSVSTMAKIYVEAYVERGYIPANSKGYDTAWLNLNWIRRDA